MPEKWKLIILRPARNYLQRLPGKEANRILNSLAEIEKDPEAAPIKPLKGREEWSYRVGRRRILMHILFEEQKIIITRIGSRGDIYRK